MTAPCKDCADRQECCHRTCSEYYMFKQDLKKVSDRKVKEARSTPELCKTVVRQIWKEMKGR